MTNYDPKRVFVTFKGILLTGFMDGTMVTAERNNDSFELHEGADGKPARVRNNKRSGRVTLTLQQTSQSNDALSNFALEDELTGLGYGPLSVIDGNGTTVCAAAEAWVMKPANAEFGDTLSGREWVFECAQLELFNGGAIV